MSDLRSLPDGTLKAYLYALGAWALGLAVLYPMDLLPWSLTLCFPLAAWFGALTAVWWVRTRRARDRAALTEPEVSSGVRSVARILALAGLLPGVVFLARDPFAAASWGTLAGIGLLCGLGWLVANLGPRLRVDAARIGVMTACWAVLPVNATGSVSWAVFKGWFRTLSEPVRDLGVS
jgi:hypothetical protein